MSRRALKVRWAPGRRALDGIRGFGIQEVVRRLSKPAESSPEQILRDRLARGEIELAEYRRLQAVLRTTRRTRLGVLGVAGVLLLLAGVFGATVAGGTAGGVTAGSSSCAAPALPGSVVDARLWDMMGGGPVGMMSRHMMAVSAAPSAVSAGEVSFRVVNAGGMVHELVVLPLPAGQAAGERRIGSDGTVSEAGSLGEASRSCGQGAGQGILPGATSWVTLRLAPGRYELVCNLPGHYAMGMSTELDVT